ncbi:MULTISPECIES: cytosine permease [Bradyrhizobium]|jgi:cytosine permease|uniref:purine-cytosine permease family protein n=2 Tax=Pseudomonadota TaxID=1224 RepID=UPI00040819A2|nr:MULTISPECIES: cytosine permease [Bradyrhizobium]KIU45468.1 allantoin permease [Bradyrhizobium elkanii]MBK5654348.1 cytosine permease [Rhizobium sp.]OCX30525.1 allantoin permease [Bradyrhizobium sp. UASWS1016]
MSSEANSGVVHHAEGQIDDLLGHEFEHEPVPISARRSAFSVTMVWLGFPMIITGAMTGSLLVLGMGFKNALVAMIIGNLIMFAYVGALGLIGTRKGMNFALIASIVFGKKGYVLASGLLSTLLLGWYAVQTGITGALISSTYGLNYVAMTIVAGVLYIGITFVGVKGLHYIGLASVPLFVVLGLWVAADAASTTTSAAIFSYAGNNGVASMSMGVGLTVVLALFIDAGTVTADFNRWAPSPRASLFATFSAFPFANLVAMLVGGVMTAALAVPNANPFGVDNMFGFMNGKQLTWLSILAFIFLYTNLGSVCSHCLYNAATGWSRILGTNMRLMAVILGVIGIVVAAGNVWAFFIQWLSLLGILVPPIGAIILVDQYLLRTEARADVDWRAKPFIAWGIGSLCAFAVENLMPGLSTAISAALVAGIVYGAIARVDSSTEKVARPA